MFSEIAQVTFGVADLDRARRFYQSVFDYECIAAGAVPRDCRIVWRIDGDVPARYALLRRSGAPRGWLRLLELQPPGLPIWGDYARYFDHGHYALNIRVPDLRAHWPKLLAAGARARSAPT
ncbi:MAG: hypothetical protein RML32_02370, partial [Gammaproteobacteria bacterium]|nr:hypothetical protein [Gammaproteobacteria bacterium]